MRRVTFILFTLFSTAAMAQDNFVPGYMETLDGTVVRGLVERPNQVNSWFSVRFQQPGFDITVYTPGDLRGYGLDNGEAYTSFKISMQDTDSTLAFLEEMNKGKVNAYRFLNRYFVTSNGVLIELYNPTVNGRQLKSYLGVLRDLFSDCSRATQAVGTAARSDEWWGDVIQKTVAIYNNCRPEEKPKLSIIVFASAHSMATKFADTKEPLLSFFSSRAFNNEQIFNGGVDIDVTVPRVAKVLSLQAGARYLPFSATTSVLTGDEFNEVSFKNQRLLIPLGLKVKYVNRERTSAYLSLKANLGVLMSQSSSRLSEKNVDGDIYPYLSTFEQGIGVGTTAIFGIWQTIGNVVIVGELGYLSSPGTVKFSEAPNESMKYNLSGAFLSIGIKVK